MTEMFPKILGGYEYQNPLMGGGKWGWWEGGGL